MSAKGSGKRLAGGGTGVQVVVTGDKQIDRLLKQLEPRLQKKHIRKAMRTGMKLVQQAAKAAAPKDSGATRKAIKVRARKSKRRGVLGIDVRIGKGDYQGDQYYAAFVEFGTSRMPAKPFMAPAFTRAGPAARSATMAALRDGLQAEVRALGGR